MAIDFGGRAAIVTGAGAGQGHGILSNALLPGARSRFADEIDLAFRDEVSEVAEAMRRMGPPHEPARLDPERVMPLALHLVSEGCRATHRAFSAVSGRYAEVFTGLTRGRVSAARPAPEEHWDAVTEDSRHKRPLSVYHEAGEVNVALAQALPC